MGIGKRLWDVARSNATDFASAFTRDPEERERARFDKELDEEIQREVKETLGAKAGRRARKVADAAEDAWERAYESARERQDEAGPGPRGRPSEREIDGWYRTLEVPVGAQWSEVRKSYRRLIAKYHPDRFADDPAKQEAATELVRKITLAYNGLKQLRGEG